MILCCRSFVLVVIIKEHCNTYAAYYHISDKAPYIRQLREQDKSEQCRKDYLRIIVYRYFLCRSKFICRCDAELTACRRKSCTEQYEPLLPGHNVKIKQQERQCYKAGEAREEEHDIRSFFASDAEPPYRCISRTCAHTAEETEPVTAQAPDLQGSALL